MKLSEKLYCSLDIETSGFDPLKDEILEVGFILFRATGKGFKQIGKFSQVFKPAGQVRPKILGLTGISQAELEAAPKFSEFREQLQADLSDVVLVGHNIEFDKKFLQAFGIKFSQPSIDTLDLAQIVLPTYHSYNLQSLMHAFRVPHKEAHRALADAQAALKLLEKLLALFQTFPKTLKLQVYRLAQEAALPWAELLKEKIRSAPLSIRLPPQKPKLKPLSLKFKANLRPNTLLSWPESHYIQALARLLANSPGKFLLVVPSQQEAFALWQAGLAQAAFGPEESFSESRFKSLLSRENLPPDEAKFLLKLLIWRFTNWQKRTIMDLNLSFAGNQYKSWVAGAKPSWPSGQPKIVCLDQQTFLRLALPTSFYGRHLVICDLRALEENLIAADKKYKFSWSYIQYLLKRIYNPETSFGNKSLATAVLEALAAADLFFGLAVLLLKKLHPAAGLVAWEEIAKDSFLASRFQQAAENFTQKLAAFAQTANVLEIQAVLAGIRGFFQPQPGRVKWLEFGQDTCVFYNYPLDLRVLAKSAVSKFPRLTLVDTLVHPRSVDYWLWRLGLTGFSQEAVKIRTWRKMSLELCAPPNLEAGTLLLLQPKALPAIAVFSKSLQVKAFYDAHFKSLQAYANLFAEKYSGGQNKLFRNFGIEKRSILLVSEKLLLRPLVSKVFAKTAIFQSWPSLELDHPYLQALKLFAWQTFPDFEEILKISNLHRLLMQLYQPTLRKVYVLSRVPIKSPEILRYLKLLPFAKVIQNKQSAGNPQD